MMTFCWPSGETRVRIQNLGSKRSFVHGEQSIWQYQSWLTCLYSVAWPRPWPQEQSPGLFDRSSGLYIYLLSKFTDIYFLQGLRYWFCLWEVGSSFFWIKCVSILKPRKLVCCWLLRNFRKSEFAQVKSEVQTNFIQIWKLNFHRMIPNLTLEYQKYKYKVQKVGNLNWWTKFNLAIIIENWTLIKLQFLF